MSALDELLDNIDHNGILISHGCFIPTDTARTELAKLRGDWLAAIKANNEVAKINADLVEALDEAREVCEDCASYSAKARDWLEKYPSP